MTLSHFVARARNKANFQEIEDYLQFTSDLLSSQSSWLQAEIVCQNEPNYRFWQLLIESRFPISRPLNATLLCSLNDLRDFKAHLLGDIGRREFMTSLDPSARELMNRVIYTSQQCIGVALDGLPADASNFARKLNGDLFERQMQLWIRRMGVDCSSATVRVPVYVDGVKQCDMNFQHDLVLTAGEEVKVIGSVKTSSKDRLGKIFTDKLLLNALTEKAVPHVAIFLNDVQRGKKSDRTYRVASTFLPGHFKAFTIKINPLDGVYYCDLRPSMKTDPLLNASIFRIDRLLCEDLWALLDRDIHAPIAIEDDEGLS
ncbi:hypothetical protein ACFSCW_13330 [Sphingomonas tabacisoli]|uniref:BsaWI restriction endonuclease type 2 domain-containing protein n=1 Tax=Sphingomonas tabacisoli TaxID=2249466 RepID=A0ABW4I7J8_9SPHN